jgi:hypothetical protein
MPIKPTKWIKTDIGYKPVFICPNQACGVELELHSANEPWSEKSKPPHVAICPNCEFIDDIDLSEIPPLT